MKCRKCKKEIENLKICPYCKAKNIKDSVVDNTTKVVDEVDNTIKNIKFLQDPYNISNVLLVSTLAYLLISIIYSYINNQGLLDLIRNSFFYIALCLYFILLKIEFGKKHFSYMNLVIAVILLVSSTISCFNILTKLNFKTIFSLMVYLIMTIYFINSFFYKYVKKIDIFKRVNNKLTFYILSIVLIVLYVIMFVKYFKVLAILKLINYVVELIILLFFSRYIYLYKQYKEMK